MKKIFVSLLIAAMLISVPAQAPASPEAPARVYELTLSHQWPAPSFVSTLVLRWIAEIEEATDGQIKITSYPGNTLTTATGNYDGVVNGIADIGLVPYNHLAGRFPTVEAFVVPGVSNFNNAASLGHALTEYIREHNPAELSDVQHLFSFSTGATSLLSERPINRLEDLIGLSLGVTISEQANMMNLLGATPISLPVPEWYEALQRNLIAGGLISPEALRGHRLADVTGGYILNSPLFAAIMFYCVMNKDTFDSLPPGLQEVMLQIPDYILYAWDELAVDAIEFTRESKEVAVSQLSDEETERWKDLISPMLQDNIDSLNSRGINGEALHAEIKRLEEKYNAIYPHRLRDRFN